MYFKSEFKQRLVTALRSGDYKQSPDALQNSENGFCCLGVACDLFDPTRWIFSPAHEKYMFDATPYALDNGVLERMSIEYLGIPVAVAQNIATWDDVVDCDFINNRISTFYFNSEQRKYASDAFGMPLSDLTEMNDKGLTFNQIADFIEDHC